MTRFAQPLFLLGLLLLFVAAGAIGGPASVIESRLMEILGWFRVNHPQLTAIAGGLTNLGGAYATLGIATAAALWLVTQGTYSGALLLVITVLGERGLVELLKAWIGRPRPPFHVEWLPQSLAFPSGHAANSMTAFLAAALIAAPPGLRRTAAIAALTASGLVGLTRLFLGVHWPSDVVGGWAFGLLVVGAAISVGERLGAIEPKHEIVRRHVAPLGEDEPA